MTDWSTKPTLRGEQVTLRPFTGDDAEAMHACMDAHAIRTTGSVHTTEEAERQAGEPLDDVVRDWYASRVEQTDRLDLAVEDRSGRLVGEVVLNQWEPENDLCNYRILLGPEGRGRGLGTEATRLVLQHAFEHLHLHRVELEWFAFNPAAGAAYAKAGFREEGRRREAFVFDGERIDAVLMAALSSHHETGD